MPRAPRSIRALGGASLAAGLILLIGYVLRSHVPILSAALAIALVLLLAHRSEHLALLVFLLTPLNGLYVHALNFSLVEGLLAALLLALGLHALLGRPPSLRWPGGLLGWSAALFLALSALSGILPGIRLARELYDAAGGSGLVAVAQTITGGANNPLSLLWHLAAAALVVAVLGGQRRIREDPLIVALTAGVALTGAAAIVEWWVGRSVGFGVFHAWVGRGFPNGRVPALFEWPSRMATYLNLALPVVLACAVLRRPPAFVAWAAGALGIAAMYLSLTRGGWFGLLLSVACLLLLGRARLSSRRLLLAAAVLAAALAPLTASMLAERERDRGTETEAVALGDRGRIHYVWPAARSLIKEHPLLGSGLGTWREASQRHAPFPLGEFSTERTHAHNVLLHAAAERGIPAALCLAALLAACAFRLFSRARHGTALWIGLAAAFPGYLFHSMLEETQYAPELFLFFWVLAGLLACERRNEAALT